MKKTIKKNTYSNAIIYKYEQTKISIFKEDEDTFLIETKRLLVLNKKEIKEVKEFDSFTTHLEYRDYSKYAIWHNKIKVSSTVMACFHNAYEDLEKLQAQKKN